MTEGGFFQSKAEGASQFWKGLHEIKNWMKLDSAYAIGKGDSIRFWDDVWIGDTPLKNQHPYIYSICADKEMSVRQSWNEGSWNIHLRRSLGVRELEEWNDLLTKLGQVALTNERDIMIWKLNKSGIYTPRSLCRAILFGGGNRHKHAGSLED
ncbi:hypothetical protein OsJ_35941 [Oryza sativa Japonica Group]|nr:hypothetical protein OsJ_35941 [Oryza sativa Japonica Group]